MVSKGWLHGQTGCVHAIQSSQSNIAGGLLADFPPESSWFGG